MAVLERPTIRAKPWTPPPTKLCLDCGRQLPLSAFPRDKGYLRPRCRSCQHERRQGEPPWVDPMPGDAPPTIMRLALARRRELGLPWSTSMYAGLTRRILATLNRDSRETWRLVFNETVDVWRAAYERSSPKPIFPLAQLRDR